jgi:tetratricopeptide (TPR) repeat protein
VQKGEPDSADVPYYIGEGYRFKGDCRTALNYYNQSLQVDNQFAPGYVGLARARLCSDPGANVIQLYDLAIEADPKYPQAYIDRASFNLLHRDFKAAMPDLQQAEKLAPDSALVQLGYAEAYLLAGDNMQGLAAAEKANSIDQTLLPAYYFLGYGYSASGDYAAATKPLEIYTIYQTEDGSAYALLGQAYEKTGNHEAAKDPLRLSLKYDPNQVRSYIYLGTANLRTDNIPAAEDYFKKAIAFFPNSFEANIGLTEVMYRKGTYGSAYLQAETAKSKATNDTQVALAIYWRALSHEGRQDPASAIKDWKALLAMSEASMTPEMRQTAQDHLGKLVPPSATPKAGIRTATPAVTPKPAGSGTPRSTPTATKKP